jgi:hypothetical protein
LLFPPQEVALLIIAMIPAHQSQGMAQKTQLDISIQAAITTYES